MLNTHGASAAPLRLFGVDFYAGTFDELIEALTSEVVPSNAGVHLLVTANVDHISNLRSSGPFRLAYRDAWVRTIDGMPLLAYAKFGLRYRAELITGSDLFSALIERLDPMVHRPFFVTANQNVGISLRQQLRQRGFENDAIASQSPPHGFEASSAESYRLAAAIKAHRSTHLFMGVGAPKSEIWVHSHQASLGDLYALCVGAALEFKSGHKKRAPVLMRKVGLEWAWRLASEPHRLGRRYLAGSLAFVAAVADDMRNRRAGSR